MDSSEKQNLTVSPLNRKAFGERLRSSMKAAGVTIEALSLDIGMSASGIKKWLYGQAEPGLSAVVQCSNALGVSVQWLATGEGDAPRRDASAHLVTASIDAELMGRVTDKILRIYKELGISIPPVDVGRLAAKWYGLMAHIDEDPAERSGALAMLAAQLKADLSTPIGGDATSKRRA